MTTNRFVREAECLKMTGLSYTTRLRLEKAGKFPKRHNLSLKKVGWLASDLEGWLASKINSPNQGAEGQQSLKFIREAECLKITGLSRTTRWKLEKAGKFPKRCKISANSIGWLASDLDKWISSRVNNPNQDDEGQQSFHKGVRNDA
jgi:prophage regulatory protein